MKDLLGRKYPKDGDPQKKPGEESPESGHAKLGGVHFSFGEDGEKHDIPLEDMPENVRQYFEELGNQMRDECGGGVIKLDSDNMPDYVSDYMMGKLFEANDGKALRLDDIPPEAAEEGMRRTIDKIAQTYAKKAPDCREYTDRGIGLLNAVFKILVRSDEDWGRKTVNEAGRLYAGVCMAVMEAVIMATRIERATGKENRTDEDNA